MTMTFSGTTSTVTRRDPRRSMEHQPLIEFVGVTQTFIKGDASVTAISDFSLDVGLREFVAIVGPSGCGKSTLLNLSAGLLRPSAGEVRYGGSPVKAVNTKVGYVTQNDNLLPWRTVWKNVRLGLEIRGIEGRRADERVKEYIALVGLGGF
jgi:NitT/TauT family transport system ATP-binding protein